jgi:hypothetical protein
MRNFFTKHKYVRIIKFNSDKSSVITYYKRSEFKPSYLINPNHAFNGNGYTTFIITDKSTETINPLDFTSKYDVMAFKSAINTKIITDTFNTLKPKLFDLSQVLLFLSLAINLVVMYFVLKSGGVI